MRQRTGFLVVILAIVSFAGSVSAAHRYHTSLTRMDYNSEDKLIEISIRMFAHDLEPVLARRMKKPVDLEKTAGIDAELLEYLNANFVLYDKTDKPLKLNWVGKEYKVDSLYVHVEIPYAEPFAGLQLQNTIFFETFAEQTNLVSIHSGEKKADLLFKAGDKMRQIKFE